MNYPTFKFVLTNCCKNLANYNNCLERKKKKDNVLYLMKVKLDRSAPLSKSAVICVQISCKLLSFTLISEEISRR